MPQVDLRWRPSGGRGEYEHVPSEALMDRRIIIETPATPGARIATDVRGRLRDGKPRLRRDDPNDRSNLNVAPLVAALALLPDPMREDKGSLELPLRDKGYVVSSITMHVEINAEGDAICTPLRMQVLHDPSTIDLFGRFRRIGTLLQRTDLPGEVADLAARYKQIAASGQPSAELRAVADGLSEWLAHTPDAEIVLGEPSSEIISSTSNGVAEEPVIYSDLSVDETKRRLVSHYKIDRDRKIRQAKVVQFQADHGSLFCENCGFSFEAGYGDVGRGMIEVHHRKPLASLLPNTMTTLADLMLLCANCHRVVHRKRTPLSAEDLKAATKVSFER